MYKYHVQYQALEYVNSILPLPDELPLKKGLDKSFIDDFRDLIELIKKIYCDMAEHPEDYGLLLIDVHEQNNHAIHLCVRGPLRESRNSLHRLLDVLYALFDSGKVQNNTLISDGQSFIAQIKKQAITRYYLIINKLIEFGFTISGYNNNKIKESLLEVSFPSNPKLINTLKTYCGCKEINEDQQKFIKNIDQFKLNFYTLDYKYLVDLSQLPEIVWVNDKIYTWDKEAKKFYLAFYEYMQKFPNVEYKGERKGNYYLEKKALAEIRYEDDLWKEELSYYTVPEYRNIILKDMKTYLVLNLFLKIKGREDRFDKFPPQIIEYMKNKKCQDCDVFDRYKKQTGQCPHTVIWSHNGEKYRSCSFYCFHFENPKIDDIPLYIDLLKNEYKLEQ